jgi:hypothetical protein
VMAVRTGAGVGLDMVATAEVGTGGGSGGGGEVVVGALGVKGDFGIFAVGAVLVGVKTTVVCLENGHFASRSGAEIAARADGAVGRPRGASIQPESTDWC